jgi:hypothetical protein
MTPEAQTAFIRGGWQALNEVLDLLNTFEKRNIPKKEIYARVMDMRPKLPPDPLN